MSLVSVIIAAYNCESYIRKAVDSIIEQTHTDLEILICDDCSADSTWNILLEYKEARVRLFRNEVNQGVVKTRNFLLTKATGEYIVIQDADDWSSNDRIEILLNTFYRNIDVAACGSAFYKVADEGLSKRVIKGSSFFLKWDDCLDLPFMPASLMIHRKVYDSLGGYNSFFSGFFAEDLYWIIVILQKYNVYYLNLPLYYYRFNPASITNSFYNPIQLTIEDLIKKIIEQRKESGQDWISKGETMLIEKYRKELFKNRKWLSEKYRIMAAVQRDGKKRLIALRMILKALRYNPMGIRNYVTLRYVLFF